MRIKHANYNYTAADYLFHPHHVNLGHLSKKTHTINNTSKDAATCTPNIWLVKIVNDEKGT